VTAPHFTAVLEVTQTIPPTPAPSSSYDRRVSPDPKPERRVEEVARIVIRADSLDALATKLAAHVAIIKEPSA